MDLTDDELRATRLMRKSRDIKNLKTEINEGTYCITLYGSNKQIVSDLISEHELIEDKIRRLDNIIDFDRPYEWEKEIYCLEVLKQIRSE